MSPKRTLSRVALLAAAIPLFGAATAARPMGDQFMVEFRPSGFSNRELVIRKGDVIVFANRDTHPHTAYSQSSGNVFNLKKIEPGKGLGVKLEEPGTVDVKCLFHAGESLTVTVMR